MSTQSSLLPVEEIIKAAESLPPFPDVVWKVMPLMQRLAPVHEIEAVIKLDPATTARVIAFSQSPVYARRSAEIGSLQDAISVLGQQKLVQVILAACATRYFQYDMHGYDLAEGELWRHSVATGLLAEMVAKGIGSKKLLISYTAGLLHDIGKNVLHNYVEDYYEVLMGFVRDKGLSFIDAERETLGVDHQQLGGLIARQWRFPPEIVAAIGRHHHPMAAPADYRTVACIVYAANRMVSALGIGSGIDGFLQSNEDAAFQELGISTAMIDRFMVDLEDALEKVDRFLAA